MKLKIALLLVFTMGFLGCDSSSSDSNEESPALTVSGAYLLSSVNGNAIPTDINSNQSAVIVSSGSLELDFNGSYTLVISFLTSGTIETSDEHGTWAYREGKLNMTHPERGVQYPDNVVVKGSSVTLNSTYGGPDTEFNMLFVKQ